MTRTKMTHNGYRPDGLDNPLSPNGPHRSEKLVRCEGCAGLFEPSAAIDVPGVGQVCDECADWARSEAAREAESGG
jgi:hypothetical protein